jgi:hypothetical protein
MANAIKHLVQVEVGGIQQYIFEGARLREWRGASALLDRINRRALGRVVADEPVEVIRSGGGVAVLLVPDDAPDGTAERMEDRLTRLYESEAPGASAYATRVEGTGESVLDLMDRLALQAATERELAPAFDSDASLLGPMVRFCDSCGRRPAETAWTLGEDGELLCRCCHAKGSHGLRVRNGEAAGSLINRFADHRAEQDAPGWPPSDELPGLVPDDLEALAETDPNGDVALVQADGNALGQTIQQIDELDAYRDFSDRVAEAVETAVFDALANHPPREGTLPWEVVFLGGDDVLLFTAASIALPVAEALIENVRAETAPLTQPYDRDHLSLGVGIAAADPHVPASVLRDLAGELEDSAKELAYARGEEVSTVDYHRLTGEGTTTLNHVREESLRPERDYRSHDDQPRTRLTARPFTADQLRSVRGVASAWQEAGLPSGKLHRLRESLFESPAAARKAWTHVVARASDERRPAWRWLQDLSAGGHTPTDAALPWTAAGREPAQRQTYLLDVLDARALQPDVARQDTHQPDTA